MIERESILSHIQTILKDVTEVQLVTRASMEVVIPSLQQFPAVCLVDFGDEFVERDSQRNLTWWLLCSVVSIVKGTTEGSAATDCTSFETEVKRIMHKRMWENDNVLDVVPDHVTLLTFPKVGPKVVSQGMGFKIKYFENITALIA